MVHSNYELFDFALSEELRKSSRRDGYELGNLFAEDQNEEELADGVLRYRDDLLTQVGWLKEDLAEEPHEEDQLRLEFLLELVGYMGIIPGALFSVWGPTEPKDWTRIARMIRTYERKCNEEVTRAMAPSYAQEIFEKDTYSATVDRTGYLLGLVADNFEKSVARSEADGDSSSES